MGNYSQHNEELNSSIAGISDTANIKGPAHFVQALKRQGYLDGKKNYYDSVSFMALVQGMGSAKLEIPYMKLQIEDLRNNERGECGVYSTLVYSTFFAMAESIHWRKFPDVKYSAPDGSANEDYEPATPMLRAA